jgi:energy-coupling factor transporter ATP-binding protein EcfA2
MAKMSSALFDLATGLLPLYRELKRIIPQYYYHDYIFFSLDWNDVKVDGFDKLGGIKLDFKIDDLLFVALMVREHVLLTGSSGSGKSKLAQILGAVAFGNDQVAEKTINPEMGVEDFCDLDFGMIKQGSTYLDALKEQPMLMKPMLILNEANRAPPVVQNVLFQILDNNLNVKSMHIPLGIKLDVNNTRIIPVPKQNTNGAFQKYVDEPGNSYLWSVITVNEGTEFTGTQQMDRALLDRITVEIPMDIYAPTFEDEIKMLVTPDRNLVGFNTSKDSILLVCKAKSVIESSIPIYRGAELFIQFLGLLSACDKVEIVNKRRVNFNTSICENCPYGGKGDEKDYCPHTSSPSNRIRRKLVKYARGIVLVKILKTLDHVMPATGPPNAVAQRDLERVKQLCAVADVRRRDISEVAPLLLRSKLDSDKNWIRKHFYGNRIQAVKAVVERGLEAAQLFEDLFLRPKKDAQDASKNRPALRVLLEGAIANTPAFRGMLTDVIKREDLGAKEKWKRVEKIMRDDIGIDLDPDDSERIKHAIADEFRIIYMLEWLLFKIVIKVPSQSQQGNP